MLLVAAAFTIFSDPGAALAVDNWAIPLKPAQMAWIPSRQTGAASRLTQDTDRATQGTHSMRVDVVAGATFVGSQTSTLDTTTIGNTAIVGDPPGLDHVTFDLTITQQFGKRINPAASDAFSGFVSIGVTIFGKNQAGQARDAQIDYSIGKEIGAGSLTPGTYHDRRIDLDALINPDTFTDESFNDLFGTQGSSPTDLIPTGFQFDSTNPSAALTLRSFAHVVHRQCSLRNRPVRRSG